MMHIRLDSIIDWQLIPLKGKLLEAGECLFYIHQMLNILKCVRFTLTSVSIRIPHIQLCLETKHS